MSDQRRESIIGLLMNADCCFPDLTADRILALYEPLREENARLSTLVQEAAAEMATLDARLAEAERERDEARTAAQSLHGLVESACLYWRGSMPVPTENESMAVAQDRLTERDLIRQADVWVSTFAVAERDRQAPHPMRAPLDTQGCCALCHEAASDARHVESAKTDHLQGWLIEQRDERDALIAAKDREIDRLRGAHA